MFDLADKAEDWSSGDNLSDSTEEFSKEVREEAGYIGVFGLFCLTFFYLFIFILKFFLELIYKVVMI